MLDQYKRLVSEGQKKFDLLKEELGENAYLMQDDAPQKEEPRNKIEGLVRVIEVACGDEHTVALLDNDYVVILLWLQAVRTITRKLLPLPTCSDFHEAPANAHIQCLCELKQCTSCASGWKEQVITCLMESLTLFAQLVTGPFLKAKFVSAPLPWPFSQHPVTLQL